MEKGIEKVGFNLATTPTGESRSGTQDGGSNRRSEHSGGSGNRYIVLLSAGWIVRGAKTGQDAINIAVSEVGKRIAATGERIQNVDISVQQLDCNSCESTSEALLLVSEIALVGLILKVEVADTDTDAAERTARREIGSRLDDTPLVTVSTSPINP